MLTSVQEIYKFGKDMENMGVVVEDTSKIQSKRKIWAFLDLQWLHAKFDKINFFCFFKSGAFPS
jgi:hypothetical protein